MTSPQSPAIVARSIVVALSSHPNIGTVSQRQRESDIDHPTTERDIERIAAK